MNDEAMRVADLKPFLALEIFKYYILIYTFSYISILG